MLTFKLLCVSAVVCCCVVLQTFSFVTVQHLQQQPQQQPLRWLRSHGGRLGTANALVVASLPNHLNTKEYPTDNYNHILGINDPSHKNSRLQEICRLRIADVELSKTPIDTQGCGIDRSFYVSSDDLESEIKEFDEQHGPPLDLVERISRTYPIMAIAAEFKKASPSKGDINPDLDPVTQCLQYAEVGASVISVLTEYKHFKGTLSDLKRVRLAVQAKYGSGKRPAVLRKDFILDRYQILEARANGADTVLLIVAVLGVEQLRDLMSYSRKFGMEPLVEVHTAEEMHIALNCGAKVIGVNNRNLHTFQLDLSTTHRAVEIAQGRNLSWQMQSPLDNTPDVLIAALSGITSSDDVNDYQTIGVRCCLIGETLMKSTDPQATIQQLLSGESSSKAVLVKACGFTEASDVAHAVQSGVNLVGLIFAKHSKRKVDNVRAKEIVQVVRKYGERSSVIDFADERSAATSAQLGTKHWFETIAASLRKVTVRKPLVVGVFQDQAVEEINEIVREVGIDVVQLHGNESPEFIDQITAPCIKVIHVNRHLDNHHGDETTSTMLQKIERYAYKAIAVLLDTKTAQQTGGTGESFDWTVVRTLQDVPVMLAGGLNPENVRAAAVLNGVFGVDVAGGIEAPRQPGRKNANAVAAFVKNAKSAINVPHLTY